jgi:hypothetical protein
MRIRKPHRATAASLFSLLLLGGCAGMGPPPGITSVNCSHHSCPTIPVHVKAGCVVSAPDIHVANDGATDVKLTFVLGQGASGFGRDGIVVKADPDAQVGLVQGNAAQWVLVDRNSKHSNGSHAVRIQYGGHIIGQDGVSCVFDPYVVNDM